MLSFLLKGVIRDRARSVTPIIVTAVGVALTVIIYCWVSGTMNNIIESTAKFQTGHVKVMSRAYAAQSGEKPNDLAYIGVDSLLMTLESQFPEMAWLPRIHFGGLLDVPDAEGETRAQGPAFGMAIRLHDRDSGEREILNLHNSLVRGRLPETSGEILVSEDFAEKLGVSLNETVTLLSTTMYGSLATYNFTITGTVKFGVIAMDRGAIIADLADVQQALDMQNAAGEILGFFRKGFFEQHAAFDIANRFNAQFEKNEDEFAPTMVTLRDQDDLAQLLDTAAFGTAIIIGVFLAVMFMVLWNVGLISSIRRYGEIGVRLAIGEEKGHLYRLMLYESLIIGVIGSAIGTAIGLVFSYYLQNTGIDISSMMKNSSMMVSGVMRAQVKANSYFIGFIPGVLAILLGTAVSGIGIYKRQTSQLFKELEA